VYQRLADGGAHPTYIANARKFKVRCAVEHVFAYQKGPTVLVVRSGAGDPPRQLAECLIPEGTGVIPMRGQAGFFDVDDRLKRFSDLDDQLEAFQAAVNLRWSAQS